MAEVVHSTPPRLELHGIVKDFPGVRALDGVSLDLRAGEIHALCGENGAGKSTLIKVLSGIHPAGSFAGEVRIDGAPVRFHGIREAEAHGIAFIAQELALVPELSVAENVLLGREPARFGLIDRRARDAAAARALALAGFDGDAARPVGELGIGQQQLVEIAKALAKDARVLVLDEPTAALPAADTARLLARLGELRGRGVSILYVSHRLEEVERIADCITVLRDGRSVGTGGAAAMPRARVIALMVGREVSELHAAPPPPAADAPCVLEVRDWSLADPAREGRLVLDGIGFEVRAGEVLGIAGLMGAGRTALVASLFGAARSRVAGTLRVAGAPARAPFRSPAEAQRAGLALVSEDRRRDGLVPEASVEDNLALATLRRHATHGWISASARAAACEAQRRALAIRAASLATPVAQLSGGNQQKVVLGRWLMAEPRVMLLDEPTRGIDVGARAEIYAIVRDLAARGLGVVLVSSDLPEVLGMSHRVLVLRAGRAAAAFARDAATPEAVMAAAAIAGAA